MIVERSLCIISVFGIQQRLNFYRILISMTIYGRGSVNREICGGSVSRHISVSSWSDPLFVDQRGFTRLPSQVFVDCIVCGVAFRRRSVNIVCGVAFRRRSVNTVRGVAFCR